MQKGLSCVLCLLTPIRPAGRLRRAKHLNSAPPRTQTSLWAAVLIPNNSVGEPPASRRCLPPTLGEFGMCGILCLQGAARKLAKGSNFRLLGDRNVPFDSMRLARSVLLGAGVLLAIFAVSCGGGGSGSSSTPPPSNVSITISPTSATVGFGTTQQFTATVSGTTNAAVTWTVTDTSGGTSHAGQISSTGLYTAPIATSASIPSPPQLVSVTAGQTASASVAVPELNPTNSVTVAATSQADTTKSASASVTLSGLSILAIGQCTVSGTSVSCPFGSTGTEVSRSQMGGQTVYFGVLGYGVVPGTSYSISGNGDIVVTQPSSQNFGTANTGVPAVYFPIVISPTATLGPRNVVVTNSGNELSAFPGGLLITP